MFNKHLMNIFHNFIPNKINNYSYKPNPPPAPSPPATRIMTDDVKSRITERSKMTKKYHKCSKVKLCLDELQDKTDECTALILDAK